MKKPRSTRPVSFDTVEEALAYSQTLKKKKLDQWTVRYTIADGVRIFDVRWVNFMKEHFPSVPVVPMSKKRDVPRLKRNIVEPLRSANIQVGDFVRFVIENWALIRQSQQFRKFKSYPDYPALAWVLKFADLYVSCFTDYQQFNNTIFEAPEQKRREEREAKKQESVSKVVRVARDELRKKDAEIAKLRAENRALQSRRKPAITRKRTAKPDQLPEWE